MSRVVIIDDDVDTCELFGFILTEAQHDARFATDGRAGLDLVFEVSPDVVIVDIFMPHMDGLRVIEEIRRNHPGTKIIAMSAGMSTTGTTSLLDLAPAFGADATLRKPIIPHVLEETVRRLTAA